MAELRYHAGDATHPHAGAADRLQLIVHCCNDIGGFGSGFAGALNRRYGGRDVPHSPGGAYVRWHRAGRSRAGEPFALGHVQYVPVRRDGRAADTLDELTSASTGRLVANLIGQHGVRYPGQDLPAPIRYDAIETGLGRLHTVAVERDAEVHAPRLGAGLAGGEWARIEALLHRQLVTRGVNVHIYDPPDRV